MQRARGVKKRGRKAHLVEEPTLRFRFTADRFGFKEEPTGPDREKAPGVDIAYAQKAADALTQWAETIDELFGDRSAAMIAATHSRILPQYPSWEATWEAVQHVKTWLGSDYSRDTRASTVDPRHSVEELRVYLRALQEWAWTFQAGVWVASVAASGSTESHWRGRLLQGLKSIAIFEFDVTSQPMDIREKSFGVLIPKESATPPAPANEVAVPRQLMEAGKKSVLFSAPPPEFASEPDKLTQWLEQLRKEAGTYAEHSRVLTGADWTTIENAYWNQWSWPPIGAVSRAVSPPAVSAVDLIYTTRYGNVPFVHWHGGNVSICQWSRILELASHRDSEALAAPVNAALANLGFGELVAGSSKTPEIRPKAATPGNRPVVMISPQSEFSPVWAWRPEPGTRCFALMPRNRAEEDEIAARSDRQELPSDTWHFRDQIKELVWVARRYQLSAALLHFIEVAGDEVPDAGARVRSLPWVPWHLVYFGFDGLGSDLQPYVQSPRSVGQLVEMVAERYRDWFPQQVDRQSFFYRLGRFVRMVQLAIRRDIATAVRMLRMVKAAFARR